MLHGLLLLLLLELGRDCCAAVLLLLRLSRFATGMLSTAAMQASSHAGSSSSISISSTHAKVVRV